MVEKYLLSVVKWCLNVRRHLFLYRYRLTRLVSYTAAHLLFKEKIYWSVVCIINSYTRFLTSILFIIAALL
jgi:hypothetical protein